MSNIENSFEFYLKTNHFEQQAFDEAIRHAQQLAKLKVQRPYQTTTRICNLAFNIFKRKLEETFYEDLYQDLIALTLQAGEKMVRP